MLLLLLQKKKWIIISSISGRTRSLKNTKTSKISYLDEDDNKVVDTEPTKNNTSPKINDLRTPLKKSRIMQFGNCFVMWFVTRSRYENRREAKDIATSRSVVSSLILKWGNERLRENLVDSILEEEKTRAKCSKFGESYCFKTFQHCLGIKDSHLAQR